LGTSHSPVSLFSGQTYRKGDNLWLDNATPVKDLLGGLSPLPSELLETVRVAPAVNRVSNV
jgi:hypothetical protein